jgi:hypothetical protein
MAIKKVGKKVKKTQTGNGIFTLLAMVAIPAIIKAVTK